MEPKILVVDDEREICEILKYNLELEGYNVDVAYSAEEAADLDIPSYSLIILDIMMSRLSGFDFAKRIKNNIRTEYIPIIFCSVLNGEDEHVMGLNIGADDYITKPFRIREVLARIRSVMRRAAMAQNRAHEISSGNFEPDLIFKDLRIDQNTKQCFINGKQVSLTKTEYSLVSFFVTHPNSIYTRKELLMKIWDNAEGVSNRTIDTNITRLRKKLGDYGAYITTRLGYGYGFQT